MTTLRGSAIDGPRFAGKTIYIDRLSELLMSVSEVGYKSELSGDKTLVSLSLIDITPPPGSACSLKKEMMRCSPGRFPPDGEGCRWGPKALSSESKNAGKAGSCPGWPPGGRK